MQNVVDRRAPQCGLEENFNKANGLAVLLKFTLENFIFPRNFIFVEAFCGFYNKNDARENVFEI